MLFCGSIVDLLLSGKNRLAYRRPPISIGMHAYRYLCVYVCEGGGSFNLNSVIISAPLQSREVLVLDVVEYSRVCAAQSRKNAKFSAFFLVSFKELSCHISRGMKFLISCLADYLDLSGCVIGKKVQYRGCVSFNGTYPTLCVTNLTSVCLGYLPSALLSLMLS